MKAKYNLFLAILLILGITFFGFKCEMYRWHSFQKVTHSDISYLKWKFLFDPSKSRK